MGNGGAIGLIPRLHPAAVVLLVAAMAAPAAAQGTGVTAEYFDNPDFSGAVFTQVDPTIYFNWGDPPGAPGPDPLPVGLGPETYSVRWSGVLQATTTGTYTFQVGTDDGFRLWIDGQSVIDRWRDQPTQTWTGTIALTAGQRYSIQGEFFENPTLSVAQLEWQPPGAGAFSPIPQAQLYPQVAAPRITPTAGAYTNSIAVALATDTPGAAIRYTTDGSVPTSGSTLYTGPFEVTQNATVRTRAFRAGMTDSDVVTSLFSIGDTTGPGVVSASAASATQVVVVFDEPVDATTAQTAGNYTFTGGAGLTASMAVLAADLRTVLVTTGMMTSGTPYTLTVANVTDRTSPPNTISANAVKLFTYVDVVGACAPTGYWNFDEGTGIMAADSVGGNTGTLMEDSIVAPQVPTITPTAANGPAWIADGAVLGALRFDGVNDYVTLAASLHTALGDTSSLSFWIRTRGEGSLPVRAPGITGVIVGDPAMGLPPNGFRTNAQDIFWGYVDENGRLGLVSGVTNDAGVSPAPTPPNAQPGALTANPVNDGQWHHVAMTRDATSGDVRIYIDGVLSDEALAADMGVKTTAFFDLARITGSLGTSQMPLYLLGDLDEVRVYAGCILSQGEIETLANRPPAVDAGPDQRVPFGTTANLAGSVTDDGLPTAGALTSTWSVLSGPGTVTFGNASNPATTATFTVAGTYVLRLTADDGQLTSSDDVTIEVDLITVTPLSGLTTTEAAGPPATFTIVLEAPPASGQTVTVGLTSSDTTEGTVLPASVVFDDTDWNVPQPVTVTGVDDFVTDGNVLYAIVTAPAVSGDATFSGFDPADVSVTNLDDDIPGITVTPTSGLVTDEGGATATFTVALDTIPTATVTVGLSSSDLTEGTVVPVSLTFAANATALNPQTVVVTGVDDPILDFSVAYAIITAAAVSADGNYSGLNPPDVSVTNLDDEKVPEPEEVWGNCLGSVVAAPSAALPGWLALLFLLVLLRSRLWGK